LNYFDKVKKNKEKFQVCLDSFRVIVKERFGPILPVDFLTGLTLDPTPLSPSPPFPEGVRDEDVLESEVVVRLVGGVMGEVVFGDVVGLEETVTGTVEDEIGIAFGMSFKESFGTFESPFLVIVEKVFEAFDTTLGLGLGRALRGVEVVGEVEFGVDFGGEVVMGKVEAEFGVNFVGEMEMGKVEAEFGLEDEDIFLFLIFS